MVGHILEKDRCFTGCQDLGEDLVITILRPWLFVGEAIAAALGRVVVGGRERLVEDLEVSPLDKDPLKRRRHRPGYGPEGYRLVVRQQGPLSTATCGVRSFGESILATSPQLCFFDVKSLLQIWRQPLEKR